uniref:Uncharacterized protein n=1 Tax=Setaria italica TaxID=4555 RepID=K3YJT3_SETIT
MYRAQAGKSRRPERRRFTFVVPEQGDEVAGDAGPVLHPLVDVGHRGHEAAAFGERLLAAVGGALRVPGLAPSRPRPGPWRWLARSNQARTRSPGHIHADARHAGASSQANHTIHGWHRIMGKRQRLAYALCHAPGLWPGGLDAQARHVGCSPSNDPYPVHIPALIKSCSSYRKFKQNFCRNFTGKLYSS